VSTGAKKDRCESCEGVARGEDGFAAGNVVTEPAADVGGARIKNIVKSVKANSDAGGAGESVRGGERARSVKNEQGMREIACAEDADSHKEATEGNGECAKAVEERGSWFRFEGAFANQKPERGDGDKTREKSPKKNIAIGMMSGFKKPESGERAGDGADGVHEALEAEGAAVGAGRNIGGEKSFFCGRAKAASEPGGDAGEKDVIRV